MRPPTGTAGQKEPGHYTLSVLVMPFVTETPFVESYGLRLSTRKHHGSLMHSVIQDLRTKQ